MRQFGGLRAYGAWWMLIEVLDLHGNGDKVSIAWADLEQIMGSKRGYVEGVLGGLHRADLIQRLSIDKGLVTYEILKFKKRQSKLKSKVRSTLPQSSPNTLLEENRIEENRIKDLGTSRSSVPKKKRKTATAPAKGPFKEFADRYFAYKFKDQTSQGAISSLYSRYGKALKDIIAFSDGDVDVAVKGTFALEEYFNREKLSFTLDTIAKRFAEWKADSTPFDEKKKPINLFDHFLAEAEAKKNGK